MCQPSVMSFQRVRQPVSGLDTSTSLVYRNLARGGVKQGKDQGLLPLRVINLGKAPTRRTSRKQENASFLSCSLLFRLVLSPRVVAKLQGLQRNRPVVSQKPDTAGASPAATNPRASTNLSRPGLTEPLTVTVGEVNNNAWSPRGRRKGLGNLYPIPTRKTAEPMTENSGHEVLLHELEALRRSEAALPMGQSCG